MIKITRIAPDPLPQFPLNVGHFPRPTTPKTPMKAAADLRDAASQLRNVGTKNALLEAAKFEKMATALDGK